MTAHSKYSIYNKPMIGGRRYIYAEFSGIYEPLFMIVALWFGVNKAVSLLGKKASFIKDLGGPSYKINGKVLSFEPLNDAETWYYNGMDFYFNTIKAKSKDRVLNDEIVLRYFINKYNLDRINLFKLSKTLILDPITQEVLLMMGLPASLYDLLYCAVMLFGQSTKSENDTTLYRVIDHEIIPQLLYRILVGAYNKYAIYKKINLFEVYKDELLHELQNSHTTFTERAVINPIEELADRTQVSYKGYMGTNEDRAFTIEKRTLAKNGVGKFGITTNDKNVGTQRELAVNTKFLNTRGFIDPNIDVKNVDGLFSIPENVGGTVYGDDPIRSAMVVKQTNHLIPVKHSDPCLVSNGYDCAVGKLTSSDWTFVAKQKGKIIELTDGGMVVQYDNGKKDGCTFDQKLGKNAGIYIIHKLKPISNAKVGYKFNKNDILAYHSNFFSENKIDGTINFKMGPLVKVATCSGFFTYEDAGIVSSALESLTSEIVYRESPINLPEGSDINYFAKIGDPIVSSGALIKTTMLSALPSLYKKMQDSNSSIIQKAGYDSHDAHHSGTVQAIEVSLPSGYKPQKGVQELIDYIKDKNKAVDDITSKISSDVDIIKSGISTHPKSDNPLVRVIYYLKDEDKLGVGDKITLFSANKQVASYQVPKGLDAFSEYNPDEPIGAISSGGTIFKRMTPSVILIGFINKVLLTLKSKVIEMWKSSNGTPSSRMTNIKKLILSVYTDLNKNDVDRMKSILANYTEKNFGEFIKILEDGDYLTIQMNMTETKHCNVEAAAEKVKVPLFEYVYFPFISGSTDNAPRTKYRVPVGYLNIKRTQQVLRDKNSLSTKANKRSRIVGQVVSDDKSAKITAEESVFLLSMGGDSIAYELRHPRSDNAIQRTQMLNSINRTGSVDLSTLNKNRKNSESLVAMHDFFAGMGIDTDLLDTTKTNI